MGNSSHLQPAAWSPLLFCCGPSVVSDQLRAPAATMSMLRLLLAALLLLTSLPVSATEPETCFSRQHQSAIVNMQLALNRQSTAMDARVVRSERDCVLACCSEEVKPGAKCNMVVFHGNKPPGDNNCFLFHCPSEQDCPLMKALDGINTYDIYKGLLHPTAIRPAPTTTTTTTTTTTPAPTTTTITTRPVPTTTTRQPTTTTTTTTASTTTTTTTPTTTTSRPTTTTPAPIIIIATMPPVTQAPNTTPTPATTTTTIPTPTTTTTTTTTPNPTTTTTTTTTTSTTTPSLKKANKATKKQIKANKKAKPHPFTTTTTTQSPITPLPVTSLPVVTVVKGAAMRTTEKPQLHPEATSTSTTTRAPPPPPTTTTTTIPTTTTTSTTTTHITTTTTTTVPPPPPPTTTSTSTTTPTTTTSTTSTITTTTTTTTLPTTTTTTTPPSSTTVTTDFPAERTTPATSLLIVPKDAAQSGHALQNAGAERDKAAQGALKSGVVAVMVLGLAVLTLALAVGGRKAMESFDRRHYTRLELNDLHYEV